MTSDDIRFYGLMLAIYILLAAPILVLMRVIGRKITLDLSSYWSALSKSTLVALLLAPALIAYHGFLVVPMILAPLWWIPEPSGFRMKYLIPLFSVFGIAFSFFSLKVWVRRNRGN